MHIQTLIEKKRDGEALTAEEIAFLVSGFINDEIPDFQMSAWAMAVFFQGMIPAEIHGFTKAMLESGRVLDYPAGSPPKIDLQSLGGVGNKIALVLAPLLACDEAWVPMICGRAPGLAGTTLDKLESIPGFNVQIDERRALAQLASIGLFIIEQPEDIGPADRKFQALREATGTTPSHPLIAASILSTKFAENLDRLVLDVKFGSGTILKTQKDAQKLAALMTKVGKLMKVKVSHLLTPMDEPLGRTVGHALEVAECVEILQGGGPSDVVDLTLDLAQEVSTASRTKLSRWLSDGTAWRKFISLVYAQDGDASSLEKITEIHCAPIIQPLPAPAAGTVRKMDGAALDRALLHLGGGRQKAGDSIDVTVGFSAIKKVGERVEKGEPLLSIHARNEPTLAAVLPLLKTAAEIG